MASKATMWPVSGPNIAAVSRRMTKRQACTLCLKEQTPTDSPAPGSYMHPTGPKDIGRHTHSMAPLRWHERWYSGSLCSQSVVSGLITHENTREFTKRQRRVRNGGRLGDLVERGSLIARRQWLSTRMRRWISPQSRLAAEAVPESAGFGRPRCAMVVLPSSVS